MLLFYCNKVLVFLLLKIPSVRLPRPVFVLLSHIDLEQIMYIITSKWDFDSKLDLMCLYEVYCSLTLVFMNEFNYLGTDLDSVLVVTHRFIVSLQEGRRVLTSG